MKEICYDVVVAGGGTAGVLAALASSGAGAKTLIVERSGVLGGIASSGMPWGGFFNSEHKQIVYGLPDKLVNAAVSMGAVGYVHYGSGDGHNWISALAMIESETARLLFREELESRGCDVLLYSSVYDAQIKEGALDSIYIATNDCTIKVRAKCFADCSGDAALAAMSGVACERGEGRKRQCISSLIRISGISLPLFREFMNRTINTDGRPDWDYRDAATRGDFIYWCPWKKDKDSFKYAPKQLGLIWSGFDGDVYLNCTNADVDSLDPFEISKGDLITRRQAKEIHSYLKSNVPGFGNSYLAHIFDIGIRESRRIKGITTLTIDDLLGGRHFSDVIGLGAYPPDHHTFEGDVEIVTHDELSRKKKATEYELPYSCMINNQVRNLIVAGRCVSAAFEAQVAVRGIGPCMVEGEASGTAAAMAAKQNCDFTGISVPELQKILHSNGVYLGRFL
jgi:hypothetical protein